MHSLPDTLTSRANASSPADPSGNSPRGTKTARLAATQLEPAHRLREDISTQRTDPVRIEESALKSIEILEKRGWLIPLKAHRYDRKRWQITIGPA